MQALTGLTALTPNECCTVVVAGFLAYALVRVGRAHKAMEDSRRYWIARQHELDRREKKREERGFE